MKYRILKRYSKIMKKIVYDVEKEYECCGWIMLNGPFDSFEEADKCLADTLYNSIEPSVVKEIEI